MASSWIQWGVGGPIVEVRDDGFRREVVPTHPRYLAWLAEGNTPVVVDPPFPPTPPTPVPATKYEPLQPGELPVTHRQHLYITWADPHLIAALAYREEGNAVREAEELAIFNAEKAAIRVDFPDF